MSDRAEAVLPLIRTRADLWRWSAANEHGRQMHEAVAILEAAAETEDPAVVFAVTQKASASALKVIMRADDSSGIIGDACRALLDLYPKIATQAKPPVAKLVDWMMTFQFDNECDYFTLDPVAYAPRLGEKGMASYRAKLADLEAHLGTRPPEDERWTGSHRAEWFTLDWNAQRLAVLTAMLRPSSAPTPATGRWLPGCRHRRGAGGDRRVRSRDRLGQAGARCRPKSPVAEGRRVLVRIACRAPSGRAARGAAGSVPALAVIQHRRGPYRDANEAWPQYRDEVMERLAASPRDAVLFAMLSLKDVQHAWELAGVTTVGPPPVACVPSDGP